MENGQEQITVIYLADNPQGDREMSVTHSGEANTTSRGKPVRKKSPRELCSQLPPETWLTIEIV